jgi:hypothetical protein
MDRLDADIAGELAGADRRPDVRLQIADHLLFADVVGLDDDVAIGVRNQLVDSAAEQLERVVADHRAEAEEAEIGRALAELLGDRDAGRAVGVGDEAEEGFVRSQRLRAVDIARAELDAAQEAAVELLLDLAAQLPQLVLDDAVVVIAVLAVADARAVDRGLIPAPALRAGQKDEIVVAVVERRIEDGAAGPALA